MGEAVLRGLRRRARGQLPRAESPARPVRGGAFPCQAMWSTVQGSAAHASSVSGRERVLRCPAIGRTQVATWATVHASSAR